MRECAVDDGLMIDIPDTRACRGLLCFFFNDAATTEIYTLSLHDALPIWRYFGPTVDCPFGRTLGVFFNSLLSALGRSEEHTSELLSLTNLVCRLPLEKKKKKS